MTRVDAVDVAKVLAAEFPGVSILGQGDHLHFQGPAAKACRSRAETLIEKAQLFNAHAEMGHVGNKRNWWSRV